MPHRPAPWVLIADIGGTNARFAAVPRASGAAGPPVLLGTRQYATFEEALARALADLGGAAGLVGVVLAVAGPVDCGVVKLTNGDWRIDAAAIAHAHGLDVVEVLNDFSALALALPHLAEAELRVLQAGRHVPRKCLAVVGPGTGLGASGLIAAPGGAWLPLRGEGGHATYAPETEIEWRIARALKARFGRVSAERVVSGQGLVDCASILGAAAEIDTPARVVAAARGGKCPACAAAVGVFLAGLGRIAGDLALTLGADEVFIGGGIVPRMAADCDLAPIVAAFADKGRNTPRMSDIPLSLIVAENPALTGLAARARVLLGGR
ncbi:glucokinase [Oleispirillum naphthae]|uniref:glucokinase n=1 Tax=Oleispirillum naphthae TaxID=2838853 RepID=UPI0030825E2E